MKQKILIVDDDIRLREMLRMILENRGYGVIEAGDGYQAVTSVKISEPDLIIMDVMMPVMDGLEAVKEIRLFSKCPVIMLTAKGEDYDQVNGFEVGADDYIIKPFTPMVLAARVAARLKSSVETNNNDLTFGRVVINKRSREVLVDGIQVEFNRKEFELLLYMAENYGISLSRDQILENVWGYDYLGTESTVDTHINRLRKKLADCNNCIKTVRGYGYKFEVSYEEQKYI